MSTTQDPQHLRDRLAHEFTRILKSWAKPGEWEAMVKANAEDPSGDIVCHSHDFCDANMAMNEAFEIVLGRGCTLPSEVEADPTKDGQENADMALWNAAWDEAKRIWQAEDGLPAVMALAERYGWTKTHTGGNCTALEWRGEHFYAYITDEAEIPYCRLGECYLSLYLKDQDHSEAQVAWNCTDTESAMRIIAQLCDNPMDSLIARKEGGAS